MVVGRRTVFGLLLLVPPAVAMLLVARRLWNYWRHSAVVAPHRASLPPATKQQHTPSADHSPQPLHTQSVIPMEPPQAHTSEGRKSTTSSSSSSSSQLHTPLASGDGRKQLQDSSTEGALQTTAERKDNKELESCSKMEDVASMLEGSSVGDVLLGPVAVAKGDGQFGPPAGLVTSSEAGGTLVDASAQFPQSAHRKGVESATELFTSSPPPKANISSLGFEDTVASKLDSGTKSDCKKAKVASKPTFAGLATDIPAASRKRSSPANRATKASQRSPTKRGSGAPFSPGYSTSSSKRGGRRVDQKGGVGHSREEEEEEEEEGGQRSSASPATTRKRKVARQKPDAFVAVRFTSPEVKQGVVEVQQGMVSSDGRLASSLVPPATLHLTLMVLRLGTERENMETAKAVLQEVSGRVEEEVLNGRPLLLEIGGVASFSTRVVFAVVKETEGKEKLRKIAELVHEAFTARGFPPTDTKPFDPHLTIAKVSNISFADRRRGLHRIEEKAYSDFSKKEFGTELISGVELLSMVRPKDSEGYYHCFSKTNFRTKLNEGLAHV